MFRSRVHCEFMPSCLQKEHHRSIEPFNRTRKSYIVAKSFPPRAFIEDVQCQASLGPAKFDDVIVKRSASLRIKAVPFHFWSFVAGAPLCHDVVFGRRHERGRSFQVS